MESSKTKLVWVAALTLSLALSIFATFRGGYIGPDYYTHFARLTDRPQVFDFAASNPPLYYLIGHGLFGIIGPRNAFPITLSILQAGLNAAALWWFFIYSERRFGSGLVHLAFVLFLAFLPVRVIHATAIGTDSTTVPLFVLLLFLFDKFLEDSTSTWQNAALLGFALGVAIFTKYSFMALLPASLVIFVCVAARRKWKLKRFLLICGLSLALPSLLAAYSFWASSRVHGYNTQKHWLEKGDTPDMNYKDLFGLKTTDVQLFRAPEYFKHEMLAPHKHSYLALSHMATFTDPMNVFQDLSVAQQFGRVLIPDQKIRRVWKTPVMQASMILGVPWTVLALIGTGWTLLVAIGNLIRDRLQREDVTAILATAFFLVMFLPIPFVHAGALFGYWTPRLILPALLYFFWAGFLLIDRKIARRRQIVIIAVFVLVLIQCTVEAVMLI
jgi:4-amino-4-deoxy-L-arabinose transferase-like glycosyltransferase